MQHGTVNDYLEPMVPLIIHGNRTSSESINFAVDTGFSGELTLPRVAIDRLNLIRDEEGVPYILADGTIRVLPRYIGQAEWHGQIRDVSSLNIEATPGSAVTIIELS